MAVVRSLFGGFSGTRQAIAKRRRTWFVWATAIAYPMKLACRMKHPTPQITRSRTLTTVRAQSQKNLRSARSLARSLNKP